MSKAQKEPKEVKEKKPWIAPKIVHEMELETRAGSIPRPKEIDSIFGG